MVNRFTSTGGYLSVVGSRRLGEWPQPTAGLWAGGLVRRSASERGRESCLRPGWAGGCSDGVLALVLATSGAERAEGRGVGAAFGGEVAAEAAHVCPGGQPELFELGELAEAQAFGDEAARMLADGQVGEAGCRVD